MGCIGSQPAQQDSSEAVAGRSRDKRTKNYQKPVWLSSEPLTEDRLRRMREEFWDTQPHYGGDRIIWDALKGACEADLATARVIIESVGIIVAAPDMTICYDERGAKYDLPQYVLSDPTNLAPAQL